jgi:hypothetical protein
VAAMGFSQPEIRAGAHLSALLLLAVREGTVLKRLETLKGDVVFDKDEIRVLIAAFESAWQAVQESGASFASNGHVEATRELLALRIIEAAESSGACDYIHLRDDALLYLTQSNRRSSGC